MKQLGDFAAGPAEEWFHSFQFSATYDVFEIPSDVRDTVGNIPLSAFMHIGFSRDDRDSYNTNGIHYAVRRIKSIAGSFERVGCMGYYTYNETFGDHLNMIASSQFGRNPDKDEREVVLDYCREMYGLKGRELNEMADVLLDMEMLGEGGKMA